MFGFVGITDVQFVRAEGVAMGDAAKAKALSDADLVIRALSAAPANEPKEALAA